MKTVVVQGDGLVSAPLPELDGQTLLQAAATPNLDDLAREGECGTLARSSAVYPLSSATTHLALLGYDPSKYYSGLAPFEAASVDVVLEKQDMAYLCQFVTLGSKDGTRSTKKLGPHLNLIADHISGIESEDVRDLIDAVNDQLASEAIQFYVGDRYHQLMVWIGSMSHCSCGNPRVAKGQSIEPFLPSGKGADILRELMEASRVLLQDHPVNQERKEAGLLPANCLWLWGPGKAVDLPQWSGQWTGEMTTISIDGVHQGIARRAGIDVLNPELQDGDIASHFETHVTLSCEVLETKDHVYLHVPLSGPYTSNGKKDVLKRIELFDQHIIGPLSSFLATQEAYRLMVVCPDSEEGQATVPTPFVFLDSSSHPEAKSIRAFHEIDAEASVVCDPVRFASRLFSS